MEKKVCSKCGRELPVTEFYMKLGKPRSRCKSCEDEEHRKWRERNPEKQERIQERARKRYWREKGQPPSHSPLAIQPVQFPLPNLEIGAKYNIGGKYEGPVIGRSGNHFKLLTATGPRCFTPAQLVGEPIKMLA